MESGLSFSFDLSMKLMESMANEYIDNWESRRAPNPNTANSIKRLIIGLLNKLGFVAKNKVTTRATATLAAIQPAFIGLEKCYAALGDEYSRTTMINYFAYKILGPRHVRLPFPTDDYQELLQELDKSAISVHGVEIKLPNRSSVLNRFDLNKWGIPISLNARSLGVYNIFFADQYSYKSEGMDITVQETDTVLDLGGSYGDTALSFANKVGANGKVFVFEFLPSNLKLMEQNLKLNPMLKDRIEVISHAAWASTGESMYFEDHGPATKVTSIPPEQNGTLNTVQTLSIDDLVEREDLSVNFIKMDIEGAELEALMGAKKTLSEQRPNLAISAYHKLDDLSTIPDFLSSLGIDYKFYLRTLTIFANETVLFAIPAKR